MTLKQGSLEKGKELEKSILPNGMRVVGGQSALNKFKKFFSTNNKRKIPIKPSPIKIKKGLSYKIPNFNAEKPVYISPGKKGVMHAIGDKRGYYGPNMGHYNPWKPKGSYMSKKGTLNDIPKNKENVVPSEVKLTEKDFANIDRFFDEPLEKIDQKTLKKLLKENKITFGKLRYYRDFLKKMKEELRLRNNNDKNKELTNVNKPSNLDNNNETNKKKINLKNLSTKELEKLINKMELKIKKLIRENIENNNKINEITEGLEAKIRLADKKEKEKEKEVEDAKKEAEDAYESQKKHNANLVLEKDLNKEEPLDKGFTKKISPETLF